jgi:CheY-specific phosphatase CheX
VSVFASAGLAAVASNALEEAAFLFVEQADSVDLPSQAAVVASIGFAAPKRGLLRVLTDLDGARLLAANVLGLDGDDPDVDDSSVAAVSELANIVAGLLLVEVSAPGALTAIDIPRVGADARNARPACAVSFRTAEGYPFRFELSWEDGHVA